MATIGGYSKEKVVKRAEKRGVDESQQEAADRGHSAQRRLNRRVKAAELASRRSRSRQPGD